MKVRRNDSTTREKAAYEKLLLVFDADLATDRFVNLSDLIYYACNGDDYDADDLAIVIAPYLRRNPK